MPWVGSEAMSLHLDAVSKVVTPGAHAVLVCDGAGWHQTGGRLRVPENITLLPLPSYSPQLNPIETVWAYLRGNFLNRRVWTATTTLSTPAAKLGTHSSMMSNASPQ